MTDSEQLALPLANEYRPVLDRILDMSLTDMEIHVGGQWTIRIIPSYSSRPKDPFDPTTGLTVRSGRGIGFERGVYLIKHNIWGAQGKTRQARAAYLASLVLAMEANSEWLDHLCCGPSLHEGYT